MVLREVASASEAVQASRDWGELERRPETELAWIWIQRGHFKPRRSRRVREKPAWLRNRIRRFIDRQIIAMTLTILLNIAKQFSAILQPGNDSRRLTTAAQKVPATQQLVRLFNNPPVF